ncbi:MAG: hypothetical protein WCF90_03225 [Methanomicrobiales archaeon]
MYRNEARESIPMQAERIPIFPVPPEELFPGLDPVVPGLTLMVS